MLGGQNVSQNDWERALRSADTNNDGRIDLHEFKAIFQSMIEEDNKQRLRDMFR